MWLKVTEVANSLHKHWCTHGVCSGDSAAHGVSIGHCCLVQSCGSGCACVVCALGVLLLGKCWVLSGSVMEEVCALGTVGTEQAI